jgi:hypothetical protein
MHIGVVNNPAGMEVTTIVIANVNILRPSIYDSSCDVTKCALFVAIDLEQRCIFAVGISGVLEQPFRITGALGAGDVFGVNS